MNKLEAVLQSIRPISLEEMDRVELLDRVDTKYVVHEDRLPGFLEAMKDEYRILKIDQHLIHPYETLYFDTPGLDLYRMHHNGKRNRFKLRFRKYINTDITFFEIKSKTNTRRTIKKRIKVREFYQKLDEKMTSFVLTHTPGILHDFVPALLVFFDRLTLVNIHDNERLTLDLNLRYKHNDTEKHIKNLVIVEVKQQKDALSPFRMLMKAERMPHDYLSKYCMGIISMNKEIKKNRFKQKMNSLTKLGYEMD